MSIYQKQLKTGLQGDTCISTFSNPSVHWWVNGMKKLPYMYGIQLSKRTKYHQLHLHESIGGYYAKWSKPDTERQTL